MSLDEENCSKHHFYFLINQISPPTVIFEDVGVILLDHFHRTHRVAVVSNNWTF